MAKDEESLKIEGGDVLLRKSPFDPKNKGIEPDRSKDRRWVDPKRIEERKYGGGFEIVKRKDGSGEAVKTNGGMVLMERPMSVAEARAKAKELLTRQRTKSAKDSLRDQVEALSSRYGQNLHKNVYGSED